MAPETKRYNIAGGPGKFHLMLSHYDRQAVIFEIYQPEVHHLTAVITKSEWEDGSSENWLLGGNVLQIAHLEKIPLFHQQPRRFRAYYNSARRTGWIQYIF